MRYSTARRGGVYRWALIFVALVAVVVAMFGRIAFAQDQPGGVTPEHLQRAREAVVLSNATKGFDRMLGLLAGEAKSTLIRTNPHLSNDISAATTEVALSLTPRIKDFVTAIARIYASHFTVNELDEIIRFYQSDIGKTLIEQSDTILIETQTVNQRWATRLSEDMMSAIREKLKEKGHDL